MPPYNKQPNDDDFIAPPPPTDGGSQQAMFLLVTQTVRYWYEYRHDLIEKLVQKSMTVSGDMSFFVEDPVCVMILSDYNIFLDGTHRPSDELEKKIMLALVQYAGEKDIAIPLGKLPLFMDTHLDAIDTTTAGWTLSELRAVGELIEMGEKVIDVVYQYYNETNASDAQKTIMMNILGETDRMVRGKWQLMWSRAIMQRLRADVSPAPLPVATAVTDDVFYGDNPQEAP